MKIVNTHNNIPIGIVGDIHGEFDMLRNKIKYYDLDNVILFQVGDFGVGFNYNNPVNILKENRQLLNINKFLKKRNIFLYVVRGNHDNPLFFDGMHNYTNIIFMRIMMWLKWRIIKF